jgi:hypothetical protein
MLAGDADVAIEVLQETADLWLSRREETSMLAETRRNNDLYESNEAKLKRQYKGSFILILTLSSTEVGRFSGHSRRLHGSHSTRVLGAVNEAPVSHSSFLLGARLSNSFYVDSPAHLRARYHQATRSRNHYRRSYLDMRDE